MKLFEILPLFSTPVYVSNINVDKNRLITWAKKLINPGDYISHQNYILEQDIELKNNIIQNISTFLYEVLEFEYDFKYLISDAWILRTSPGDNSTTHFHHNSMFTGVIYIDAENTSDIVLEKREYSQDIGMVQYKLPIRNKNIFNSKIWNITPKDGDIIIFPSYLYHYVSNNNSIRDRISLAFNIMPENYKCNVLGSKIL